MATAIGGAQATKALTASTPEVQSHLLFTDIIMPGGMKVVALARPTRGQVPGFRILLTTGYAGDVDVPSADEGSEFELIYKPYQQADLALKIRLMLDGRHGAGD